MTTAFLSMGSNLGDRLSLLAEAIRRVDGPHTRVDRVSSVYETAPQGKTDQPLFLNLAVQLETDRSPVELLHEIQAIEQSLGRVRSERWGPRTIDIDLLLHGQNVLSTAELELPHPRITERAFVLVPLLELAPALSLPTGGPALSEALLKLPDQGVSLFMGRDPFLKFVRGVK